MREQPLRIPGRDENGFTPEAAEAFRRDQEAYRREKERCKARMRARREKAGRAS